MRPPQVVLCGGVRAPESLDAKKAIKLDINGPLCNVHLQITDISTPMLERVDDVLCDLLEIAAYVYSADQAVSRGSVIDTGGKWRRRFEFHVPVRRLDVWSRDDVTQVLSDLLNFLSDDTYAFTFSKATSVWPYTTYFKDFAPPLEAQEVLLFSGGLDSLAGAITAAIDGRRDVALVSHRSAPKRVGTMASLATEVRNRAAGQVHHIPVWATKSDKIGQDFTQRTRSFLFASLAAVVAKMLGLGGISFYENGITSCNLPLAEQVVGARATRTTHPQTINGFRMLFGLLFDSPFAVETPFLWKTKVEILQLIAGAGCSDLVRHAISCSRTVQATTLHTHCGDCSQCVERRLSAMAAGLADEADPAEMYKLQILTDPLPVGEVRTMAESYVRKAVRIKNAGDIEFFKMFPEATRLLNFVDVAADEAARRIVNLHRRFAREVEMALIAGHQRYAREFQTGVLSDSCLLVLATPEKYRRAGDEPKVPTFRPQGDHWEIWFENERTTMKDGIGLRYLSVLLDNPGKAILATDLLITEAIRSGKVERIDMSVSNAEEDGLDIGERVTGAPSGKTDRETIAEVRMRMANIERDLEQLGPSSSPDRRIELEQELDALGGYVGSVLDLHGKPRPDADDDKRAADAVRKALDRLTAKLNTSHPALARHLRGMRLRSGNHLIYDPHPRVVWVVR